MAIDDDPLIVMARQIQEDSSDTLTIGASIAQTLAHVILPGHIGEYITGVLGAVSQKRWNERIAELLSLFAKDMAAVKDQVLDERYYEGEEFQALIYEAIDQERTNHLFQKRKMLSAGLAHSGTKTFVEEPEKQVFFRILRDIGATELQFLQSVGPNSFAPTDVASAMASRLEALGLLGSTFNPPNLGSLEHDEGRGQGWSLGVVSAMEQMTKIYWRTDFADRFIAFLKTPAKT